VLVPWAGWPFIYIFIRLNCSFKNKKFKKNKGKGKTTCQRTQEHFQRKRYKYIFQIKYTEAISTNSTRKLLSFEISKMVIAVLKIKFIVFSHLL